MALPLTFSLLEKQNTYGLKPSLEIGWDGGVNDENAAAIAAGGGRAKCGRLYP